MRTEEDEDENIANLLIKAGELEAEALQLREEARRAEVAAAVNAERRYLLQIISGELTNPGAGSVIEGVVRYRIEQGTPPGESP